MSSVWDASHAPTRPWRAGAWSLELRDDELADLAHDGVVVLRAVRAVVRDRNWDTATTLVESVADEGSVLELRVRTEGLGVALSGTVRVEVDGDELRLECDLRAARAFETARSGLVVLHPPSLAGSAATVVHPDGSHEAVAFPRAISPHQPALDVAALAWATRGVACRLAFAGDVFEMEDQRNWTDASFKTYSRPLDLPFPYPIAAGEHVRQAVSIRVRRSSGAAPRSDRAQARIDLQATGTGFPEVGTGASTAPDPAPAVDPVGAHLLVELDLASSNWRAALDRAAAAGLPLDVRFILDGAHPGALRDAVPALADLPVRRVTAFPASGASKDVSDAATIDGLRAALPASMTDVLVVGGARSHFTELNREHARLPAALDGVVFSITPLFHATSTEQLVESVAMQRVVAQQAVLIAEGRPVHVGPVTLRPRFNNVATGPPAMPEHHDLREGYGAQLIDADDPRQAAEELAAWTIASAAALSVPGVQTLTYFEDWGPRGVRSGTAERLPAADAIALLQGLRGLEVLSGDSPDGLLWAVGVRRVEDDLVVLANLDRDARSVTVTTPRGEWRGVVPASSFLAAAV